MNASHFSGDIKEFLFLLHKYHVKYLIVGGEAVIYYGFARLTGDIDIFFDSSDENIRRLFQTLKDFWQGDIPEIDDYEELKTEGIIIQFGVPPNRIDLMNKIENINFSEAWKNKLEENLEYKGQSFTLFYISLDDLIKNKAALNRYKDLEDLKFLKKIQSMQNE